MGLESGRNVETITELPRVLPGLLADCLSIALDCLLTGLLVAKHHDASGAKAAIHKMIAIRVVARPADKYILRSPCGTLVAGSRSREGTQADRQSDDRNTGYKFGFHAETITRDAFILVVPEMCVYPSTTPVGQWA